MSLLQPPDFHHHSPKLHLAFLAAHDPDKGKPNGEWLVIKARGASLDECECKAFRKFLATNPNEDWKIRFIGYVV
jgi:hypothetical protein